MTQAVRMQATVLPGHRIELCAPEFPDGHSVEVIVVLQEGGHNSADHTSRYPAFLEAEYGILIQKKLDHTLSEAEAERLEAVRDEIVAFDRSYPNLRTSQAQQIADELQQIRAELESLPAIDARK